MALLKLPILPNTITISKQFVPYCDRALYTAGNAFDFMLTLYLKAQLQRVLNYCFLISEKQTSGIKIIKEYTHSVIL